MDKVEGSANDYLFCLANLIRLIADSRLVLRTIFGKMLLTSTARAKQDTNIKPAKMSRTRILR